MDTNQGYGINIKGWKRLAVKNMVNEMFKSSVTDFPNWVMHDETEKAIMEWDGSHYNNHYMIIFIFFEDNN